MSLAMQGGRSAHYPANPEKFEFDREVSAVFPDMARRSIPLFYETHNLHAALCEPWFQMESLNIMDIGASRGAFISALADRYNLMTNAVRIMALDQSLDMIEYLAKDFAHLPNFLPFQSDITGQAFDELAEGHWDIINCTYVVQFAEPQYQAAIIQKLTRLLRPGGVLFLGQKLAFNDEAGAMLHEQYIQFRVDQGYSRQEIEAKTRALSNSMWPLDEHVLLGLLKDAGLSVRETSRWTVFNNYMCLKD